MSLVKFKNTAFPITAHETSPILRLIDQDNKQVAREAILIRIKNPALNCNIEKMYIPDIFNNLLGADRFSNESH